MQSLNNNTQAFLALVRAGLWGKDAFLSQYERIDYNEVFRLAEEQTVVGLVAAGLDQIKDLKAPKEVVLQFVGRALQLEQQNIAMNQFVASVIEFLRKDDVYSLLVKGQGVAQCYERPFLRTSGDVDLYLSDSNYKKAKRILLPLASYVDEEDQSVKHLAMTIDSWAVELHGSLLSKWLPKNMNKMIDRAHYNIFYMGEVRSWNNSNTMVYLPSPQNDAIIIFTHILEHFFVGGIGLRQICDWCRLLWTYRKQIDWSLLECTLKEGGLLSEWNTFAALAVEYLGMPNEAMPLYSPSQRWSNKAKRAFSIVLKSGNLGHNKDVSYSKKYPYIFSKLISFWNHMKESATIFPIFPLDSSIVWLNLFWGRLGVLVKGK